MRGRVRWRMRNLAVLVWLALAAASLGGRAQADEGGKRGKTTVSSEESGKRSGARAAVIVVQGPKVDPFFGVYTFEVAAALLRKLSYSVVPPKVAAERWRKLAGGGDCAKDESCLRSLARELAAPSILVVQLGAAARKKVWVHTQAFVVYDGKIERSALLKASGAEGEITSLMQKSSRDLQALPRPCEYALDSAALALDIQVDEREIKQDATKRFFLSPGSHTMNLRAQGRDPWQGEVRCEAGRSYRVHVR